MKDVEKVEKCWNSQECLFKMLINMRNFPEFKNVEKSCKMLKIVEKSKIYFKMLRKSKSLQNTQYWEKCSKMLKKPKSVKKSKNAEKYWKVEKLC